MELPKPSRENLMESSGEMCQKPHCYTAMVIRDGKLVCPLHDVNYKDRTMMEKYLVHLGDPHNLKGQPSHVKMLDFFLRELIGKTDDIRVPLCSHTAIINREFEARGMNFCRVCQKDLSVVGVARVNDYLVLRHEQCRQPICCDCAKDNPDAFHIAFKEGWERYKLIKELLRNEHKHESVYV